MAYLNEPPRPLAGGGWRVETKWPPDVFRGGKKRRRRKKEKKGTERGETRVKRRCRVAPLGGAAGWHTLPMKTN